MSERPRAQAGVHVPALAALAAAVSLAYGSSFGAGFVLDSRALILENPMIHRATAAAVGFLLTHDYWQPLGTDGLYRPLATLSYLLNYAVLGDADRPLGYHVVNLTLHLACVALVYALVWHLCRRRWPALVAAALFGLHPVATEAVTNIVGRADLLAALGVLAGLLCHAHGATAPGWRRWGWTVGLGLAAVLAFFSKEIGLVLVAMIVAYDLVFLLPAGGRRLPWRDHVLTAVVLAGYLGVRWWVARSGLPAEDISPVDNPIVEAGFWTGRLTAVGLLGRQLRLLLWPVVLSADYSYRQIPVARWPPATAADWRAVATVAALVAVVGVAFRVRRRHPALFFLLLLYALAVLPTANLLTIIGSIFAERFLYLPLVGFAGVAALAAEAARGRAPGMRPRAVIVTTGVGLVLLACGWRTWVRGGDWRDELRLWSSTVRASPASAKAHKGHAAALFAADPRHENLERVIAEAERAVDLRPDYTGALTDLGSYYIARGDLPAAPPDARGWYEKSIAVLERARQLDLQAARRFEEKMLARGDAPDAIPDHGDPQLYNNLSLAYVRAERFEEALAAYESSRRLDPANPAHYVDISAVLCKLGRWEEASVTLLEALTLEPGHRDAALRLAEVYRVFYPEGHAVVRDGPDQVRLDLDDPVVHRHRCRAYLGLAAIYTQAKEPAAAARAREVAAGFCRSDEAAAATASTGAPG